jgi:Lipoprotein signal peptidase
MLIIFSVFTVVVAIDRIAKSMVTARLQEGAFSNANIFGVRLGHVVNRRNPWGSAIGVRLMAVAWLVLAAGSLAFAKLIDNPTTLIGLGALLGGAMGNLVDGISRRGVTDFIDLRVWPVFNVADTAIVCGATLLLWDVIRLRSGA